NFDAALTWDPSNYVATLFGHQKSGSVTFKLHDFQGAETVSIMGDFTGWTKKPIAMKKEGDGWVAEVKLPKGELRYKFVVNDEYLADSKNYLHTGTGPNIFSKLYVW
ncbi:MAG: hypothetical protein EOO94_03740, partial [Pedobacter sp.]